MPAKIYENAPDAINHSIDHVLQTWHPDLKEAGLRVAALFVYKLDTETGTLLPCLRLHGAPAAATIRRLSDREKANREFDVEITIDKAQWESFQPPSRLALLDHELTHVVLKKHPKTGILLKTEEGHVIVRLQQDDFTLTGFTGIVARHGTQALEWQSVERVQSALSTILSERSSVPAGHQAPLAI